MGLFLPTDAFRMYGLRARSKIKIAFLRFLRALLHFFPAFGMPFAF